MAKLEEIFQVEDNFNIKVNYFKINLYRIETRVKVARYH